MKLRRTAAMLLTLMFLLQSSIVPAAAQVIPTEEAPAGFTSTDSPANLYSISGQVTDGSGNGIAGVTVTAIAYPIILLPGVMGTALRNTRKDGIGCSDRTSEGIAWVSLDNSKLLALELKEDGITPANGCDQITAAGRVDEIGRAADKDFYKRFIVDLVSNNFTVLDYPGYDWRLDLDKSAEELDEWIDKNKGDAEKVILIGHSMGGLLARSYISDKARAAKVAKIITVGTPYWGAPITIYRLRTGELENYWLDKALRDYNLKRVIRNSPGAMQLLPSRMYMAHNEGPAYYSYSGVKYTDYDHLATALGQSGENQELILQADAFHSRLDDFSNNYHFTGDHYVLYSKTLKTPSIVSEESCSWISNICVRHSEFYDGDGTVPYISAGLGSGSNTKRGSAKFCGYKDRGMREHGDLMVDIWIRQDVVDILQGKEPRHCEKEWGASSAQSQATAEFRKLVVWGEDRVRVEDQDGNFTGVGEDGSYKHNLLDVTFHLSGGGVTFTMPLGAPYKLVIERDREGPIAVEVADYGQSNPDGRYTADSLALFSNVPSTPNGKGVVTNAGTPLPDLELSLINAAGTLEQALSPDGILDDPELLQDTTMPTTTLTIQGPQNGQGDYTGPATVTISAVDDNAGVLKSYYSLDAGQSWQEYSTSVQIAPGEATSVQAHSVDRAGNQEYPPQVESLTFAGESRIYLPFTTRGSGQRTTPAQDPLPAAELRIAPEPEPTQPPVVPIQSAAATQVYTAITGADGRYTLADLPAGTYEVKASRSGFTMTPTQRTVTVPSDDATNVDFTGASTGLDTAEEILIPAGTFQMGCDASNPAENGCNEYNGQTQELPLHTVYLDAYNVDKYEVTNARYQACVDAGGCTAPHNVNSSTRTPYYGNATYANYPVVNVTWHQATAFCAWAGKRLPTEAEWEKAARGHNDTRKYPWGNADSNSTLLNYNWNVGDTSAVGSYPAGASPYGVMDMAGNVWEWVNDWHQRDYYSVSPDSNPQGPATGEYGNRVMRGGSWFDFSSDFVVRSVYRGGTYSPVSWHYTFGFRCVRSP